MVPDIADRRRPGNETVLVVMPAGAVEIGVETQLCRVTLGEEILAENIRNQDLLIARVKLVEIGVGIFLQHLERRQVVLPAIVIVVPKNSLAEVGIVEDESTKVTHERLNAKARGNEVIVISQVAEMNLGEGLLKRSPILVTGGVAQARIGIEHAGFLHIRVVGVINTEQPNRPLNRLECGLAFEDVDPDGEVV